jgi:hypothetical protein
MFFRNSNKFTPRTLHSGSSPHCRLVAYYSHSDGWKPLAIKDNTTLDDHVITDVGQATSLFRSGTVEWEIPDDWESVTNLEINSGSWGLTSRDSSQVITHVGGYTVTGPALNQVLTMTGVTEDPSSLFLSNDRVTLSGMGIAGNNKTITMSGVSANSITTSTSLTNESGADCTVTYNVDGATQDPRRLWTAEKWPQTHGEAGGYAILFGIKTANAASLETMMTHVCDNKHSKSIKIVDPKHISINAAMVAQSIGFTRKGKYYQVTDKLGKSDIRRIGAAGGNISFGGVDLGNYSTGEGSRSRERLVSYQKEGTPVYYDARHKNGKYTRLFGVIQTLSEDIPIGEATPKYGISMVVSQIAEFDSDGTWTEDLISLGGKVGGSNSYLLN